MDALVRQEAALTPVSVESVVAQVGAMQEMMKQVMKNKEHYGVIDGCGDKPTLFKSGAEKIASLFQLGAEYDIKQAELGSDHREYRVSAKMIYTITGRFVGTGVGICSTKESKYRWRKGGRICPDCGANAIKKSKFDDKGWYCFDKAGGCGGKWRAGDQSIEGQNIARTENPDIADQWNTVLKMAIKRAFVAGILASTAASDIFTQDIEDFPQYKPAEAVEATVVDEQSKPAISKERTKAIAAMPHARDFQDEQETKKYTKDELDHATNLQKLMKQWIRDGVFKDIALDRHNVIVKNLKDWKHLAFNDAVPKLVLLHKKIIAWCDDNDFDIDEVS